MNIFEHTPKKTYLKLWTTYFLTTSKVSKQDTAHKYEYDKVFPPGTTQGEVFTQLAPSVASVLDGYEITKLWSYEVMEVI